MSSKINAFFASLGIVARRCFDDLGDCLVIAIILLYNFIPIYLRSYIIINYRVGGDREAYTIFPNRTTVRFKHLIDLEGDLLSHKACFVCYLSVGFTA